MPKLAFFGGRGDPLKKRILTHGDRFGGWTSGGSRHRGRAIRALHEQSRSVDEKLLAHLSPLGWEHISLTGDYAYWPHPTENLR